MMHEEFEQIAGYEVSYEDYTNIIEPMYMALPNVSKKDFVSMIDKKRFALKSEKQIVSEIKKVAIHLSETCDHYTDFEAKENLEALKHEYSERFHCDVFLYTSTTLPDQRGCSFPSKMEIAYNGCVAKVITLVTPWYEK